MELSQLTVQNPFPNPIFFYKVNITNELNQNIINDCLSWKISSGGLKKSNAGGWHSENTLFKRKEPNIRSLCDLFLNAANQSVLRFVPSFPFDKYNLLPEGWVNIGSKLSFNFPHFHPGYNLSGVYYLKVSKARSGHSGLLQFLDPRGSVKPFSQGVRELEKAFDDKFTIRPDENLLIIFPSWLHHWVTPNLEDEERISMAFNFRYQTKIYTI